MFEFLAQNVCPKCICFLCIRYYNLFSFLTSLYLLIKLIIIISKKPVLLEWLTLYWYRLILAIFTLIFCNISSLTFAFPFSFNLYLFWKLSWCSFFIFLPSNNAFSLSRSFLSSLTWLSSLLFHQGCLFSPFVLFFLTSHYLVTSFNSVFFKSSFTLLTSINSFLFSTFLRHGNLVLCIFRISDVFFSISFSSSTSPSLILKPNSLFSCRLVGYQCLLQPL